MMDLEAIYSAYKGKVLSYLCNKVGQPALAEDLCSEVFLKIAGNLDRFDPQQSSLSTWVFNITRNTLYDHFRTRHETIELDETVPTADDLVETLCNEETLASLTSALESLPKRDCELIIRHYYNNETLREIALRFGMSYSYIKVLHQATLKKLKKYFENQ